MPRNGPLADLLVLRTFTGVDQSPFRRSELGIAFGLSTQIDDQGTGARREPVAPR
jgi:hypothetical protein